jgi:ABC-type sugar transport system ATPase subunit
LNEAVRNTPLLETKKITKIFPNVTALNNVSFSLYPNEVLVLVGENGAGKSTLMKILAGAYEQDGGIVLIEGKEATITDPDAARQLGINIVYQEQALIPDLDAIDNIFIGREVTKGWQKSVFSLVDKDRMREEAKSYIEETFGLQIDLRIPVRDLPFSKRQIIEIIRALMGNTKILILDEPTSALEDEEREHLFTFLKTLKKSGVGIIYCSHDIQECLEIGDRIMVLRDGEKVGELEEKEASVNKIIEMMIGKTIKEQYLKEEVPVSEKPILSIQNLSHESVFHNVSFNLHRGEILGIGGLANSGKYEVGRALFGAYPIESGTFTLKDEKVPLHFNPSRAIRKGIAFLPADRKTEGLFLDQSVKDNIVISNLGKIIKGWIRKNIERKAAEEYVNTLSIKTPSIRQIALHLSGGNQQKLMISRWIFNNPDIIVFEEPTRGIDVNAKVEVYRLISHMVKENKAVIIISSELPELAEICDRVVVMHGGKIAAELSGEDINQETIAYYSVTKN